MSVLVLDLGVFPCWRHHRTADSIVVHSQAECDALGQEWADTPMAFDQSDEPSTSVEIPALVEAAPAKRKGGRPKKVAA